MLRIKNPSKLPAANPKRLQIVRPLKAETGLVLRLIPEVRTKWYDYSGKNNHGTRSGTTKTDGRYREGLKFNGTSDYVEIAHNSTLAINGNLTITAWIKLGKIDVRQTIVRKEYDREYYFRVNDNNVLLLYQGNETGYDSLKGTVYFEQDKWYFVGVTRDIASKKVNFYVNGEHDVERAYTFIVATGTEDVTIGVRLVATMSDIFKGTIDEVRIYNRVLSPAEILEHYRLGRKG